MSKQYKLFLDDVRQPQMCVSYMYTRIGKDNPIYLEHWIIVRNYNEFTSYIENHGLPSHVSFDHDLAEIRYDPDAFQESFEYMEETGADCATWLVDYCRKNDLKLPICYIHSMNPVGSENIKNILNETTRVISKGR